MPARRVIATALGLAVTTGCAGADLPPSHDGVPAVRHVQLDELPDAPQHLDTREAVPVAVSDGSDPATVASNHILDGLTDQGIETIDVGTTTLTASIGRVTVRVMVTHLDGRDDEQTSLYDVEVIRSPADDRWVVHTVRAVQ